jgi:two-component system, chemotaxis family, sensor kinase Cph1
MSALKSHDYASDPRTLPRLQPGEQVDASNCLREPIRVPNRIQPHGVLLVLDSASRRVVQASANSGSLFGCSMQNVVGADHVTLLGGPLSAAVDRGRGATTAMSQAPLPGVLPGGTRVCMLVHLVGRDLLVELEPAADHVDGYESGFHDYVRTGVVELEDATTVLDLCERAARAVRTITGFDRVWVYRFESDGHGVIVAEDRRRDIEPFLGLHYPETDIPPLARALFLESWLRFIPDVFAEPVPLTPEPSAERDPVDMGSATLRAVSPIHVQYLKNMGVRASMSISLIVDGNLWGLISCHHYDAAHLIAYQRRAAAEFVGIVCSMQIAATTLLEDSDYRLRLEAHQNRLLEQLVESESLALGLAKGDNDLLGVCAAQGAAIVIADEVHLVGTTPGRNDVSQIISLLRMADEPDVFVTDCLTDLDASFEAIADVASGIIALPFSRQQGNFILWFRPEVLRTIEWGEHTRPVRFIPEPEGPLTPRTSFAEWAQTVRLHSKEWRRTEIAAVNSLRAAVGNLLLARAERLARANADLVRANEELDAFAYIASHDLKEPLRGIHTYSSILAEDYADTLDGVGMQRLESILRLSRRMGELVDSLLEFAQVGRADLHVTPVDITDVAAEALEQVQARIDESGAVVTFGPHAGAVRADRDRLREVLVNLVANAVKYNESQPPRIEIGVTSIDATRSGGALVARSIESEVSPPVVFVRDNGIGVPADHHEEIFRVFRRLHGDGEVDGGTGVGLTICRRIVERHGGAIWVESTPGEGSCFYFTLETA